MVKFNQIFCNYVHSFWCKIELFVLENIICSMIVQYVYKKLAFKRDNCKSEQCFIISTISKWLTMAESSHVSVLMLNFLYLTLTVEMIQVFK